MIIEKLKSILFLFLFIKKRKMNNYNSTVLLKKLDDMILNDQKVEELTMKKEQYDKRFTMGE